MKTKEEVEKRLHKIRDRYLRKFLSLSQQRIHTNCVHNHEHKPLGEYKKTSASDVPMSPRKQVTLVVLNQDSDSIRLCMYGSEDPEKWSGDICDNDDISSGCKLFEPRISINQAEEEFSRLLENDEYVLENYKDMATLQWVLEDRIYKHDMGLFDRVRFWFIKKLFPKKTPVLPAHIDPSELEGVWDDSSKNSGS